MEIQPTEQKKSFLQNDRLLVCSMLAIYGICFLGVVGTVFWGLNRRNQTISTNATATAAIIATEQAKVTATAVARTAEQEKYEYIERFDRITGDWFVGMYERKYGNARITIRDGVYIWNIIDSKSYTQATDFYKDSQIKDFDIYVDSKFVGDSKLGAVCSGFFFRKTDIQWEDGAYIFTICNDSRFEVQYYGKDGWHPITVSGYISVINRSDWNRIEISARGNHFTFTINNTEVFEMTNDRLKRGSLGVFINITEGNPAEIWFDNFGYQSR